MVDVCYSFISSPRADIISLPCAVHVIPLSIAEWSTPTITGDIPLPLAFFSFTQLSSEQMVMFGGSGPGGRSSVLRVGTVSRDNVVSV